MAKGSKNQHRRVSQCRPTPYPLASGNQKISEEEVNQKNEENKCSKSSDKEGWGDVTCSVCLECPHDAVLLLCSSHNKGCRPYMCATSYRYSNCLNRFKKACTDLTKLSCPLCRGQVKSWTVDVPARQILNTRKRSCMQDDCSFIGTYREMRKHMREEHPLVQPQEVDPTLEQKWKKMEHEIERNDVLSTIMSSMPGAVVVGDYVIDFDFLDSGIVSNGEENDSNQPNFPFPMQDFEASGSVSLDARLRRLQQSTYHHNEHPSHENRESVPTRENGGHRSGRVVLGRSGRRQRRREAKV